MTLPSGGIHTGENPIDGAIRELEQEVGLSLVRSQLRLLFEFELDHDNMHDDIYAYEVVFEEKPDVQVDNREVIEANFESLDSALASELTPVAAYVLQFYANRKS